MGPRTASTFSQANETATGTNNNNKSMTINNNSIGGTKSPLWDGGGGGKLSSPERLPSMNGADHNEFYIEDTEQVKVNLSFKASLVESKNFTLFRRGSLRRSRKVSSGGCTS
uniref:Uncharacterized protein n=1 Tax=Anopheles atroparvus TaxID=41427 RepID=A0A182J0T3_ANOAO